MPSSQTQIVAALVGALAVCSASATADAGVAGRSTTRPPVVDPYRAALAFARCMRAHGVPHPDPDRGGSFRLTPADEAKLRRVGRARVEAADKACFHFLRPVVSTKPLSDGAKRLARAALQKVRGCMRRHGYVFGEPVVRDMTRGRAFFGFADVSAATRAAQGTPRYRTSQRTCERGLAHALDEIVADDRGEIGY
jgi:hypothetical protein